MNTYTLTRFWVTLLCGENRLACIVTGKAFRWMIAGLMLALIAGTEVQAADEPLVVETTVLKVTHDADGREVLVEAPKAGPDDVLVYRAIYRNTGAATLGELTAVMPVPPGLEYLEGSAAPAAIEATRDGKTYFRVDAEPLPAPVAQWRALRWAPRDVRPGESFTIELRARVTTGAAEAP
ncbi:MAG: DUF11 domain-containing protein [Opitutaceae bacterium]|nr:DUF11 domain-containing protein [Opitutaceae bacterium]